MRVAGNLKHHISPSIVGSFPNFQSDILAAEGIKGLVAAIFLCGLAAVGVGIDSIYLCRAAHFGHLGAQLTKQA